jgi:hypothetical protein
MKFGKRQKKGADADPGAPGPDPVAAPVAEAPAPPEPHESPSAATWTVPAEPAAAPVAAPVAEPEPEPAFAEPEPEPTVHEEPVVEGEAFELFTDEPPAPPEALQVHQHQPPPPPPEPMPFPVAEQPVAVVSSGAGAPPVTTLGDAGQAFASGHAAGPSHGPTPGPSWQEPVMELANERPELVVGAAFAGGLLFAMILRRLGS